MHQVTPLIVLTVYYVNDYELNNDSLHMGLWSDRGPCLKEKVLAVHLMSLMIAQMVAS